LEIEASTLRARKARKPLSRLIFPDNKGTPNDYLLRMVKILEFKAGLNCGNCINKAGKSCAEHPACKHVILHKFRKTFGMFSSVQGLPLRTIQNVTAPVGTKPDSWIIAACLECGGGKEE
jgi:hypothetical protein